MLQWCHGTGGGVCYNAGMSGKAVIVVSGSWAELARGPQEVVEAACSMLHPERQHMPRYNQRVIDPETGEKVRAWDGVIHINKGNRFPVGFVNRVSGALREVGYDVIVRGDVAIDPALSVKAEHYGGITLTLRPEQLAGLRAMLSHPRGIVELPTATGKTAVLAALARLLWERYHWRTLIVTSRKGLVHQMAKDMRSYFRNEIRVGRMGDGHKELGIVTCGTTNTLAHWRNRSRGGPDGLRVRRRDETVRRAVLETDVLIFDETHHGGSDSWTNVARASRAKVRYGVSGTVDTGNAMDNWKIESNIGPVLFRQDVQEIIDRGTLAEPKIVAVCHPNMYGADLPVTWEKGFDRTTRHVGKHAVHLKWAEAYSEGIVRNRYMHKQAIRCVQWMVQHANRNTLLICRSKAHWTALGKLLDTSGVPYRAVWGDTQTPAREEAKALLAKRKIRCLLATVIMDEGESVDSIEAIVLAEGVRKDLVQLQRIGRGMRREKGSSVSDVWVLDLIFGGHPATLEHGLCRVLACEEKGYDVRVIEAWPKGRDIDSLTAALPFERWGVV